MAADLSGASILVAGSSRLLPAAIAKTARQHGARTALAGCPLSEAEADDVVDAALETLPALNTLILVIDVAAIGTLHAMALDVWDRSVLHQLRVAFWLTRRMIQEFLTGSAGGRLVFVLDADESAAGGDANPVLEQALVSLARCVAKECGRRAIRCNVVRVDGSNAATAISTALFFASNAASFVNGECISVQAR